MNWAGIIVGVFLVAGLVVAFFHDFETSRSVDQLTNEERMAALGRVVAVSRRRNE